MARYKPIDTNSYLLPIDLSWQLLPSKFRACGEPSCLNMKWTCPVSMRAFAMTILVRRQADKLPAEPDLGSRAGHWITPSSKKPRKFGYGWQRIEMRGAAVKAAIAKAIDGSNCTLKGYAVIKF